MELSHAPGVPLNAFLDGPSDVWITASLRARTVAIWNAKVNAMPKSLLAWQCPENGQMANTTETRSTARNSSGPQLRSDFAEWSEPRSHLRIQKAKKSLFRGFTSELAAHEVFGPPCSGHPSHPCL